MKNKEAALHMRFWAMLYLAALISFQNPLWSYEMVEEKLFFPDVAIATKKLVSQRATPSVVSVITREEILSSGAGDMQEALTLLVPGFVFSADMEGVIAPIFRGVWTLEGKILLLIDGLEVNERVFGGAVFGPNHYSLDGVERIEVIRGPGSALYGGFAELAVINVITRGPSENSAYATLNSSQMSKTFARQGVSAGYGLKQGDFASSLSTSFFMGNLSQKDILDFYGDRTSMHGTSDRDNVGANLNLTYKDLDFRAVVDRYHSEQVDLWGANYLSGPPLVEVFDTYLAELKYDFKPASNLTLTPRLFYKADWPWVTDVVDQGYTSHKWGEKKTAGLTADWDITPRMGLLSGVEWFRSDVVRSGRPGAEEADEPFRNGRKRLGYDNYAAFFQLMNFTDVVNVTVGSRYDYASAYGSAFVPRLGLTKVIGDWHAKAMASQSFRTPTGILPNRTTPGKKLEPEIATHYELETGYALTPSANVALTGFDTTIKDPLIYTADPVTGIGSYTNSGKLRTRGGEAEYRHKTRWVDVNANYAYYYLLTNNVATYTAPDHPGVLLGAPTHRVNLLAGVKFGPRVSLHPSASFFSRRYAFTNAGGVLDSLTPVTIYNVHLRVRDLAVKGLEAGLGVRDIFDRRYDFAPGYNNAKGPLPGPSRAITVRLAYDRRF